MCCPAIRAAAVTPPPTPSEMVAIILDSTSSRWMPDMAAVMARADQAFRQSPTRDFAFSAFSVSMIVDRKRGWRSPNRFVVSDIEPAYTYEMSKRKKKTKRKRYCRFCLGSGASHVVLGQPACSTCRRITDKHRLTDMFQEAKKIRESHADAS